MVKVPPHSLIAADPAYQFRRPVAFTSPEHLQATSIWRTKTAPLRRAARPSSSAASRRAMPCAPYNSRTRSPRSTSLFILWRMAPRSALKAVSAKVWKSSAVVLLFHSSLPVPPRPPSMPRDLPRCSCFRRRSSPRLVDTYRRAILPR